MSLTLMPHLMRLDVYSHGFRVSRFNDAVRRILVDYCRKYIQWGLVPTGRGSFQNKPVKVFAAATRHRDVYFFHRNVLDDFLEFMKFHQIPLERIQRVDLPLYEPAKAKFIWHRKGVSAHDYQEEIVDFFLPEIPRTKVSTLQTGKGKSLATMFFMLKYGKRTVLIMKPMYMKQWERELIASFKPKKGEMYVVQGSAGLKSLIDMAKDPEEDFNPSIIMISNATYRNYLRSYFDNPELDVGYGCKPWEFFETLKAGVRVIDELHQDFHLNFLIDCTTNIPKTVSLSATMKSDDRTLNRMYDIMLPPESYAPSPAHDRYISVYQVMYRFHNPERIKYTNWMRQYNSAIYEKSIRKQPKVLQNYLNMVLDVAKHQWAEHRDFRKGMKLAVYCGTQDMCDLVLAAFKKAYPTMDVRRKIDEDPEENLLEADIIVTTLQSAGTARDIPDLAVCISTIALSSMQANQQFIGRLRHLKKWPEITPRFYYLICRDIEKHLKFANEKAEKIGDKVKDLNILTTNFVL